MIQERRTLSAPTSTGSKASFPMTWRVTAPCPQIGLGRRPSRVKLRESRHLNTGSRWAGGLVIRRGQLARQGNGRRAFFSLVLD